MLIKSTRIPSAPPARTPAHPFGFAGLLAFLLGLATMAVYWPVTGNDFVNFDDNVYVQANAQVQNGLTLENIKWAFTHTVSGNWHPLTMLSHMLDCQMYGLNPWGHHLTSLLFHAANTVLLFLLLQRLTGAVWRSAWVAALFAVHPLHVESVAWVAERKDVLSAFFGFLTLVFYVRYARPPASGTRPQNFQFYFSRDYWLAAICLTLGLMSKSMLVTWPFILLLLDYWPLGRFQTRAIRPLILEKIPFFGLMIAACFVTLWAQKQEGAVKALNILSVDARCAKAVLSYGRYLLKMFWPADLAVYYPYPKYLLIGWLLLAAIVLTGVSAWFWSQRRSFPFLLVGWLWFLGTLVPVIGLVQVGSQSIADRYMYLPSVGLLLLTGWGAQEFFRRRKRLAFVLPAMAVISVALCIAATRQQIAYWKNSEILFRHTLDVTMDNDVMQNNLAVTLYEQGRTNDAISGFLEAIRINPGYSSAHLNLGKILAGQGRTVEALTELHKAVKLAPADADARRSLGNLLFAEGQTDEAVKQFEEAVHFQTNIPESWQALAGLLLKNGQTQAALSELQAAVQAMPSNPYIRYQLGNLLLNNGQTDDAINSLQETIRLKPDFYEAHNNLGSLLSKKGRLDQAISEFQAAIRLNPDFADAHYNLGTIYLKQGLNDKAADEFQTAIQLAPGLASTHYYLGTILMKKSLPDEAIARFREAIRLQPDYAFAHDKLGVALGTKGDIHGALAEFQEAVRLKPDYAEANTNLAIALKMLDAAGH